ncbi:hypothetical protein ACSBR2_025291 [Camellia fascicularis]
MLNEQVDSVSLVGQSSLPRIAFIESLDAIRIKRSCNGLLLCEIHGVVYNCKRVGYVVCNLTIQKFTLLPERGGNPSIAYLAFDPSQSPHYKSWKHITVDVLPFNSLEGVFWNGAIHYLNNDYHFRLDVGSEEMIRIPNPVAPKIHSADQTRYFGECDGHLILIQMPLRFAMGFRILQMEKDPYY